MALGKPERKLAPKEIISPLRLLSQKHDLFLSTNFSGCAHVVLLRVSEKYFFNFISHLYLINKV